MKVLFHKLLLSAGLNVFFRIILLSFQLLNLNLFFRILILGLQILQSLLPEIFLLLFLGYMNQMQSFLIHRLDVHMLLVILLLILSLQNLPVSFLFLGKIKPEDFGGIGLTAVLLATYGHRACELGNFAFGSYNPKTKEEKFPEVNFVRFAIPRLRYEKKDLDSVAESLKELYEKRHLIPPIEVIYGKELSLRHFKARFKFKK